MASGGLNAETAAKTLSVVVVPGHLRFIINDPCLGIKYEYAGWRGTRMRIVEDLHCIIVSPVSSVPDFSILNLPIYWAILIREQNHH